MVGIYDLNIDTVLDYKSRLDIYKKCGFADIGIYLDERYQREDEKDYSKIINYAHSIGLKISQVHLDYKISNEICNDESSAYFDYIASKMEEALKYNIPIVVAHASKGDTPPKLTDTGKERFKEMMKKFEGKNIVLAIENVRNNDNLDSLLSLGSPNVKVCFDLGHAHAYGNEYELFQRYHDKIICTHLHNNCGSDTHHPLDKGEIDYKYFLTKLNSMPDVVNTLECFPKANHKLDAKEFEEFIKHCFDVANH